MIKIVRGVYGHYTGKKVEPKDKNSDPFQLSPEQEQRLVEQGVAVYVDEEPSVEGSQVGDKSVDEMGSKELREYGKSLGLSFKVGTKNAEMKEAINNHLALAEGQTKQPEADAEPAPTFDPTEAVQ